MPKFRKKPVVVAAEQFTHDHTPERVVLRQPYPGVRGLFWMVETLHGWVRVNRGDWILPEPEPGLFYPVDDTVFRSTYEPVDA